LPASKYQSYQVNQSAIYVYGLKLIQLSSVVNDNQSYSTIEIFQMQREESAAKCNVL